MNFIKVHLVYQNNPMKKATTEADLLMRESYFHACDIIEITPIIPDDESIMAKCYIRFNWNPPNAVSVMETAEEVLELIKAAEFKSAC